MGRGAAAISPAARGLGDPTQLSTALIGQFLLWLLAAAVVAIVLFWEKQTLGSLWLQPFHWQSVVWGLLFVVAYYAFLFPAGEWVRRTTGLPGFAAGMELVDATGLIIAPVYSDWWRTPAFF